MTPFAHQIFAEAGFPGRVEITDTVFSWEGWQGRLDVRFIGVRIYDDQGRRRAEIPKLAVALDGWALLRGSLAPSRIELIDPSLRLTRSRTGQIGLGLGQDSQTGFNLLSLFDHEAGAAATSLRELRVTGGNLELVDEGLGLNVGSA